MARNLGDAIIGIVPDTRLFGVDLKAKLKAALKGVSAEVPVTADTLKLDAAIARLQVKATDLKRAFSDISVKAETTKITAQIAALQKQASALHDRLQNMTADVDKRAAQTKILALAAQADQLKEKLKDIPVGVELKKAQYEVVKAKLDELSKAREAAIKPVTDQRAFFSVRNILDYLTKDRTVKIKTDVDKSSLSRAERLLAAGVGGGGGGGGLATNTLRALTPGGATGGAQGAAGVGGIIAGTLGAGFGAVIPVLAAATLGLGAFGAVAAPTLANLQTGMAAVSAATTKYQTASQNLNTAIHKSPADLAAYKAVLNGLEPDLAQAAVLLANQNVTWQTLTPSQRAGEIALRNNAAAYKLLLPSQKNALNALIAEGNAWSQLTPAQQKAATATSALSSAFSSLTAKLEPLVLTVFTKALKVANDLLPFLAPLAKAGGDALSHLMDEFDRAVKSPGFRAFLANMTKLAGPALVIVGEGIGKIAAAMGNLLLALENTHGLQITTILFTALAGVIDIISTAMRTARPFIEKVFGAFAGAAPGIALLGKVLGQFLGDIIGLASELLIALAPIVKTALPPLLRLFEALQPAIAVLLPIVGKFLGFFTAGLATVIGLVADALTAIIRAVPPKVLAGIAAGFLILWAVLALNPLGLVVVAISAVAEAIVLLIKHWSGVATAFDKSRHVIASIFDGIRHDTAVIWDLIWRNTIGREQKGVADVVNEYLHLRHDIANIWDSIRHDTAAIWDLIWRNTIGREQKGIADVVNEFNHLRHDIANIFDAIRHDVATIFSNMWHDDVNLAGKIWHDVAAKWDSLRHSTADIYNAIRHDVATIFSNMWHDDINMAARIGSDLVAKWDSLRHNTAVIFDAIRHDTAVTFDKMRHDMAVIWDAMVKDAGGIFDKIANTLAAPINWVIKYVLDDGLIKGINAIASFVGIHNAIPNVPGIPKFARGGRVPGFGGGDRVPALLEGGEAVVPKNLVPRFAKAFGAMGIPGFAKGGYVNPIPPGVRPERIDQGVDFAGAGKILAIGNSTIIETHGGGWPGGPYMSYRLEDGVYAGRNVYVAENISPTVVPLAHAGAGTVIANMFNGGTGIEMGWADAAGSAPLSQTAAAGGISGANLPPSGATAVGKAFDEFLISLGAPGAPNFNSPTGGKLPPAGAYLGPPVTGGGNIFGAIIQTIEQIFGGLVKFGKVAIDLAHGDVGGAERAMLSLIPKGAGGASGEYAKMLLDMPITLAGDAMKFLLNPVKGFVSATQASQRASGGTGTPGGAFTGPIGPTSVTVAKYLLSQGASKAGAAGIAATIFGESGLQGPESVGTGGFGLIGWTGNTIGLPSGYHGPTGNVARDWAAQLPGIIGYARARPGGWPGQFARITDPIAAGNLWSAYEAPAKALSDTRPFLAHLLFAQGLAQGGLVMDSGGWIPPGRSVVDNRTGSPEHLTRSGNGLTAGERAILNELRAIRHATQAQGVSFARTLSGTAARGASMGYYGG